MDNDMLEVYLFEGKELLEQLEAILLKCEKAKSFDSDSINEIFRIMHTIKGSSAMMQFDSLTTIAHKVEDLFFYVRDNGIKADFTSALSDIVFKASDFLNGEIGKIENSQPLTTDTGALEDEIGKFLAKISGKDSSGGKKAEKAKAAPAAVVTKTEVKEETKASKPAEPPAEQEAAAAAASAEGEAMYPYAVRVFLDENAKMLNIRALMLVNSISEIYPDIRYEPSELQSEGESVSEEITRDGFLISFKEKSGYESGLKVIEDFLYTKSFTPLNGEPEGETEVKKTESESQQVQAAARTSPQPAAKQSLINVKLSKLDQLMDLMGEIVITESMVTSAPQNGGNTDNYSKASRQLRKLTDELQEIVMSIRMVPVSGVFQRMSRIVRDMNKKLDKDVNLVLVGEDTEMDKAIVDSIGDPIMHLVRNSMDHGIESAEERRKAGKPEKGTIKLTAQNTGGEILISVEDDGQGIDEKSVLKKAKERGLMTKPENDYTKREIFNFLMMPGFSTNKVVTEYSGRGVGMDVVKKNIEEIGGTIRISSEPGKGTKTLFKIPLTLAIIDGMKVQAGDCVFTIPIYSIRQLYKIEAKSVIKDTDENEIVMIRDKYYPLVRLNDVYHLNAGAKEVTDGIVVMIETHEKAYCVFADSLLGEQQVVVKPIPAYLNQFNIKETGVAGCAILGDGSISVILDMTGLLNSVNI